jgi:hypothetical protein
MIDQITSDSTATNVQDVHSTKHNVTSASDLRLTPIRPFDPQTTAVLPHPPAPQLSLALDPVLALHPALACAIRHFPFSPVPPSPTSLVISALRAELPAKAVRERLLALFYENAGLIFMAFTRRYVEGEDHFAEDEHGREARGQGHHTDQTRDYRHGDVGGGGQLLSQALYGTGMPALNALCSLYALLGVGALFSDPEDVPVVPGAPSQTPSHANTWQPSSSQQPQNTYTDSDMDANVNRLPPSSRLPPGPRAPEPPFVRRCARLSAAALACVGTVSTPSVSAVEALFARGAFELLRQTPADEAARGVLGLAGQMCYALGLHRDLMGWAEMDEDAGEDEDAMDDQDNQADTDKDPQTGEEPELHKTGRTHIRTAPPGEVVDPKVTHDRAVFWMVFKTDVWEALITGRPPMFVPTQVDAVFPTGGKCPLYIR